MNKTQQKIAHYAQLIETVVTGTEDEQQTLAPPFEALRQAIDEGTLDALTQEDYQATKATFEAGTARYAALLTQLQKAQPPARLMGNHLKLTKAFNDFVAGCQAMTQSLNDSPQTLDQPAFDAAEQAQDDATDRLMKAIQKITILMQR